MKKLEEASPEGIRPADECFGVLTRRPSHLHREGDADGADYDD